MVKSENRKWAMWLLVIAAMAYSAFFFAKPINLATADLGRHIINGELIVNGVTDVLYTNHYSYTEPDHGFVNHHWASGVVFYFLHSAFGFKGLSVLYILLSMMALMFMVMASGKKENWPVSVLALVSVVPLVAYRVEIRPEGFSYALIACYYYLFSRFRSGAIPLKLLIPALLVLQLMWVNLHIFFFLGIMVAVVFFLDALVNRRGKAKELGFLVGGLIIISLGNPHTYKGLFAPLTIFTEYGYMVAENQSVQFMLDRFGNPELTHFIIFGVLGLILVGVAFWKSLWKPLFAEILLVVTFGVLASLAVRGIPLFALFLIPLIAGLLNHYVNGLNFKTRQTAAKVFPIIGIIFCLVFIALKGTYVSARKGHEGLGLIKGINGCGEFLRKEKIPGPVFNNYDIGSYLIYYLHDREKVFVDNRPEAYSVAFFDSIYKPMQQNEDVWRDKSSEYGINVICFFRLDNTPWAQPFLIKRTQDPEWVPIFVDAVSLVLVRNIPSNQAWIQRHGIDRKVFSGVPNK